MRRFTGRRSDEDLIPRAVPPENSIRVSYRASGVIARGFYSLAYIADVPCAGVT